MQVKEEQSYSAEVQKGLYRVLENVLVKNCNFPIFDSILILQYLVYFFLFKKEYCIFSFLSQA